MDLKGRSFLKLLDYTPEEINYLLDLSARLKDERKKGIPHKIADGKITFSMVDEGDGTTNKREYTESFSQDGDTLKIGTITLTKSK